MRQLLSALSYFSIFFAPFLFPIIVWIVARDRYIEGHAKRALFSHIFPFIAAIPLIYFFVTAQNVASAFGFVILFFIIYGLSFVYNVFKGIQVLREYA
ncbi:MULTISPECIES: DUF4870 domain-containing protein [Paenibacillus]|uniref:Tic20 family protein n=1 Tax=Paenibacillus tundrae TaxID=528187 RepID=A0ABT9WLE5_9BACL|nr:MULTISPECIES: DUF4870 domain-containing protein [Paenibacillus]MCG7380135.1 DUF4870 domain-containing protein [Paenibacillus sp. ACRSA]MDQ0173914.1 putative Tic20 family protein [Paenibacillus tundrae]